MNDIHCPACAYEYPYQEDDIWVCSDCQHRWNPAETLQEEEEKVIDINGVELQSGDDIVVMKDLKVKGASGGLKSGTKAKNIRLVLGSGDGHNITCKIDGFGQMYLKSEFVKKA